jgi:hypothetical protein
VPEEALERALDELEVDRSGGALRFTVVMLLLSPR